MKEEEAGGHWYSREGRPCHSIAKKDGKGSRPVNMRWDRALCLVPSVTTVLSIINKHNLNVWKENQMILAALTLTRKELEDDADFCKRVRTDAFAEVVVAADVGTLVHNAIECQFEGKDYDQQWSPYVAGVMEEIRNLYPRINDWVAEKSFAHQLGFGGCCDLHSPSTGVLIDFKGKDGDFSDNKGLAFDQYIQLAAYGDGLSLPLSECANIFFSRSHPGVVKSVVWDKKQIAQGKRIFHAALTLWKELKGYNPSFVKQQPEHPTFL
jgi:hypothetical protein